MWVILCLVGYKLVGERLAAFARARKRSDVTRGHMWASSVLVDSTHLPSLNRPRGSCARRQNLKKCAAHGGRVKSYKFCQTMPIYGVITLLLPSKLVLLIGPTWSHCVNWQAPLLSVDADPVRLSARDGRSPSRARRTGSVIFRFNLLQHIGVGFLLDAHSITCSVTCV